MATNAAVVIDLTSGQPLMVVVPDFDTQLSDPAYNPPNSTQILVPMETYQISTPDQLQSIIAAAVAQLGINVAFNNMSTSAAAITSGPDSMAESPPPSPSP